MSPTPPQSVPDRLAPLVTHRVSLDEIDRAFEVASDKRQGVGKLSVVRS